MTSHFFRAAPLLSLCLLFGASGANAANMASGQTTVSNVQFHVTDLTPADNQAAGMNFINVTQYVYADYYLSPISDYQSDSEKLYAFQAADHHLDTSISHAAIHVNGIPGEAHGEASISASAAGRPYTGGTTFAIMNFSLLPHSGLTITGDAVGLATTSQPTAFAAQTNVMFMLSDSRTNERLDLYEHYLITSAYNPSVGFNDSFALTFNNNSDAALGLELRVGTGAAAWVLESPVPEPSGYAMLGAGVLLLAALHKRRGRSA